MNKRIEEINELYDLYLTTPEGRRINKILEVLDRHCSTHMSGEPDKEYSWFFIKKKILVQVINDRFVDEEETESFISLGI